ncbi:MAG: PAS domain S-box protein [Mucilaginibacter polytrichastri]|nr:PAS domain S-box protein [Mucilaginibacter polytrichastri]
MSVKTRFINTLIDTDELYQTAPCGYFSLSPDGTLIKINQTLLAWLGYTEEEMIGEKFTMLLSRGGQVHFELFFWPLVNVTKTVKELSYEIVRKDGSSLPVLLNATAKMTPGNKIAVVNAAVTDITERKSYELELLKAKKIADSERKRLEFMADLTPEMIWTATASGSVNYVNARFCTYFHCERTDTRAAFILSKVHPGDVRELLGQWQHSLVTGNILQKDVRLMNRSGYYEWHAVKAALFVDEKGGGTNWFGSCSNIEEHMDQLRKKDEFISIASHELKTPVTSLKAILQVLDRIKDENASPALAGLITKANRSILKVHTLIDDLLNASQMKDGELEFNKTRINLSELIGDCVHHVRIDKRYEIVTSGDTSLTVLADEGRIEQVLTNLITNAIKYAPESLVIAVHFEQHSENVRVEVRDQGPGIPADRIPHLFERYYQVNTSGSTYSGLGLGLFICSEIIKRHGGRIGVESTEGTGSTFWFTLPV